MKIIPDLRINHESLLKSPYRSDLKRFIYVGGASCDAKRDAGLVELGELRIERLDLVVAIRDEIEADLIMGRSPDSVLSLLSTLKKFFVYVDVNGLFCDVDNLESNYLDYSEYLFMQAYGEKPSVKKSTAYGLVSQLSSLFGKILGIPQATALYTRTRHRYKKSSKRAVGKTAEKQNLEKTFKAGRFLTSLIEGITKDKVLGNLPMVVPVQGGLVKGDEVVFSSPADKWLCKPKSTWSNIQRDSSYSAIKNRQPVEKIEGTKRWLFVNLRVTAEFFVFIAQSGMNQTQARNLKRESFKYRSSGDSWIVTAYKKRKGGNVSFKIYKSYKPYFEKYLSFVNYFFPNSVWLFPIVGKNGKDFGSRSLTQYSGLRSVFCEHDIPWIVPSQLRNTRVNWLLRRSGDEELTADMSQHTKAVLRERYELPNQQRAISEITLFWKKNDPIRKSDLRVSLIDSQCSGRPEPIEGKPSKVVSPNCINPSGCLWCSKHRDVDTEDYVWSLMSFRHLKTIEAAGRMMPDEVPADLVVDRVTEKLSWFRKSSRKREGWVEECEQRIDEQYYHPNWSIVIEFLE